MATGTASRALPRPLRERPLSRARLRPPRGRGADAALASGVFLLVAVGSLRSLIGEREESWAVTSAGWVLIAAVCGALYFCRRHPVAVAAFVLACNAAYYLNSAYDGPLMVAFVVALYSVAAEGRLQSAIALAALSVIGTGLGTLAGNEDVNGVAVFMLTGWLVGVIALGWVRHSRQAYAREAEQRAASEERLRIARELHDVIGHHISLVNVQSAAALRRLQKDPVKGAERAGEALGAIKESSRQALRELRATLGVLRQADEAAPTAPTAGLDRMGELVEAARLAGLDVRTQTDGGRRPLPTEVDLAAYRIVQESLTNVTRHARATTVTVRVDRGPADVTVEITDDGQGPAPAGGMPGSGISGMRERARALGGELTAGPAPGRGFTVRARLPYEIPYDVPNVPKPNIPHEVPNENGAPSPS
ncbi:sensor histidine kinase [Streptomyces sp. HC44]|uniref:histidine kinase n=1 Tax=Streptomyces scabichelini TaxID=2711217 RepID=A0A6G4VDM1_9ACTN|nr:sensor histidine kinase [Streptomyces scabichelini]NGO12071.1 sensor histidine kinase [Streptomyces scabichelini]